MSSSHRLTKIPIELSPATVGKLLSIVDDALYSLLMTAIADGNLIVSDITPLIKEVTDPERRLELVKAVCLRNIRQGDSN